MGSLWAEQEHRVGSAGSGKSPHSTSHSHLSGVSSLPRVPGNEAGPSPPPLLSSMMLSLRKHCFSEFSSPNNSHCFGEPQWPHGYSNNTEILIQIPFPGNGSSTGQFFSVFACMAPKCPRTSILLSLSGWSTFFHFLRQVPRLCMKQHFSSQQPCTTTAGGWCGPSMRCPVVYHRNPLHT